MLWSWSGNTLKVAERISELSGAEIYRIEAADPYPEDYDECVDRAKKEQDDEVYPEIANPLANWEDYDVVYLMHGWGGHAGEYFEYDSTRNVIDNLIGAGGIPPAIFVSPTFYHPGSGSDFSSSVAELRAFHQDFENHLMPTVEGRFRTCAALASDEDLKVSRGHRVYGGFSLGSVTAWLQFCYDYDYIRSFIPMSGLSWCYGGYGDFQTKRNVDFIEQLVSEENLDERGYFIYHTTGMADSVKSQSIMQADEMLARGDAFTPDHYVFCQKDGGLARDSRKTNDGLTLRSRPGFSNRAGQRSCLRPSSCSAPFARLSKAAPQTTRRAASRTTASRSCPRVLHGACPICLCHRSPHAPLLRRPFARIIGACEMEGS